MDRRALARNLAIARTGVGASALLTTKLFALLFGGRAAADDRLAVIMGRLFGIRDVALGLATLSALDRGEPAQLLQLGIACDVADTLSILAGASALPWRGRVLGVGLAVAFAAVGIRVMTSDQAVGGVSARASNAFR